jgi:hypothetical protein
VTEKIQVLKMKTRAFSNPFEAIYDSSTDESDEVYDLPVIDKYQKKQPSDHQSEENENSERCVIQKGDSNNQFDDGDSEGINFHSNKKYYTPEEQIGSKLEAKKYSSSDSSFSSHEKNSTQPTLPAPPTNPSRPSKIHTFDNHLMSLT